MIARRHRTGMVLALLLLLRRDAAAQTPDPRLPFAFEWSAPSGCPSSEHVRGMLLTILGSGTAPHEGIAVRALAEPAPAGRWRVTLVVDGQGESGHRQLDAESCAAAADAAVLIAALMIDPTRAGRSPEDAGHPSPPVAVDVPVVPQPPQSELPRATTALPISASIEARGARNAPLVPHLAAGLAVGGDVGTLSRVAAGGELFVAASLRHLRLELAATYWPTVTATRLGGPVEGVQLAFATLGVRGAYLFERGRFTMGPVVGVEADRVTGTGFGGSQDLPPQTALWAAFKFGGMAAWSLGARLSLSLTLEGVVPTSRPPFDAEEPAPQPANVLQRVSPVLGRSFLAVEVRFF